MEQTQRGAVSAEISTAAVRIVAEYTGRGPTKAHTVINRDSVLILLGDTLTKGERSLAGKGMSDHVRETRRLYQSAMREDLIGAVEEHTGRRVIAFMSDNHVDPDMAAEVFVLDSLPGTERDDSQTGLDP
jgi:uncharacterized protein YbcI